MIHEQPTELTKLMNTQTFSTLIAVGAIATTLSLSAESANAFTINNTSAVWDNVSLSAGYTVGSNGVAADANNKIKFIDDGSNRSEVRWGSAAYGTKVVTQTGVSSWRDYIWGSTRHGRYTDSQGQQQYGYFNEFHETAYTYENQSGLGFQGINNLELEVGDIFNIGELIHFNQTIKGDGLDGKSAEISINLDFGDSELGSKTFDFALSIDETTNNKGRNNNGQACAYQTDAGKGCSDLITWDFAVNEANNFTYEDETYSLELMGFADDLAGQNLVNSFVSQEDGNNSANLFARLVKVDTTKDIPEPSSLLGLAAFGLYFAHSRKKRSEEQLA